MLKPKYICTSIIIIGILWLLFHLILQPHTSHQNKTNNNIAELPTAYASKIQFREYNAAGKVQMSITADQLQRFQKDLRSTYTKPYIHYHTASGLLWLINADQGSSLNDKKILLQGHVVFYRPRQQQHPFNKILTSSATLYPKQHIGKTAQPVVILRPGSRTEGVGMITNLKTGTTTILAKGQGKYHVQAANS